MVDIASHAVFRDDPAQVFRNQYVYHYTQWDRLLDISETGFRLSALSKFNDPRESQAWTLDLELSDRSSAVVMHELESAVADIRSRIRVGAFARDEPYGAVLYQGRRGFARPRMWAQYAGNHTGVCIVFDRTALDGSVRRRYPAGGNSWTRDDAVRYVEIASQDPAFEKLIISGGSVLRCVESLFMSNQGEIFFVKHKDWADEYEYRWVHYAADISEDAEGPYIDIKGNVAALVLGSEFRDSYLPVAQVFARAAGLEDAVVRCHWDRLNLNLEPFARAGEGWRPLPGMRTSLAEIMGQSLTK
jgi:hypothetical protein